MKVYTKKRVNTELIRLEDAFKAYKKLSDPGPYWSEGDRSWHIEHGFHNLRMTLLFDARGDKNTEEHNHDILQQEARMAVAQLTALKKVVDRALPVVKVLARRGRKLRGMGVEIPK